MDTVQIVKTYFTAERDLGLFLVVAGVVALGVAGYFARTQQGTFLVGLLVPLVLVGIGAGIGGGFLAVRSHHQVAELTNVASEDPPALAAQELPRMERVNANWPRIKAAWAVTTILCLGAIFGIKKDGVTGTALVLYTTCALMMTVDTLAERRAWVYTEHLRTLSR